jgi:XTP/dITP diphosphohydrolase
MKSIIFVSSNERKFKEVKSLLFGFNTKAQFVKKNLVELQADSIEIIALNKSQYAFLEISKPLIVEDDGLFIDELLGFPGQYSAFVFNTIGNSGIIKLMGNSSYRRACFKSVVAFSDGKNSATFSGETVGTIARKATKGGWGYDPIFIPENSHMTYGMLETRGEKGIYSHRATAIRKFAQWFLDETKSKKSSRGLT